MKNNKYKRLIIISAIFMIAMPILNNVILVLIFNNINGDIMYRTAANIIDTTISILATFILYFTLGILVNSLLRKKFDGFPTNQIIILYVISLLIVYISDFTMSGNIYAYIIYMMFVVFSDIIILISALFICKKTVRRNKITQPQQLSLDGKIISMKNPVLRVLMLLTIVIFAYNFTFTTIETVILIVQNGFPGNLTEVMYLLEPYISFIIYAAAGYLTMFLISMFWQKLTATE